MVLRVKCYDILHDTGASMCSFVLYTVKEPKKEGKSHYIPSILLWCQTVGDSCIEVSEKESQS